MFFFYFFLAAVNCGVDICSAVPEGSSMLGNKFSLRKKEKGMGGSFRILLLPYEKLFFKASSGICRNIRKIT